MKSAAIISARLLADSYREYHRSVFLYIYYKIGNREEAEDLSQDVFLRLMEYDQMICIDTVKSFIFTIARNLVNDFLRRYYRAQEMTSYMYEYAVTYTDDVESRVIADDLLTCEKYKLGLLPARRRTIYALNRYEEKTTLEISRELNLSYRTVENHLFISRKEMREYMRQCI